MSFDGQTFDKDMDEARLLAQLSRVKAVMQDGVWRTNAEISALTRDPETSVGSRMRDFRKLKFGGHTMTARPRGPRRGGLWEYQLILNKETEHMTEQPKIRRRLTDEEKIARAKSQIDMVQKRAKDKQRERVQEALLLLDGVEGHRALEAKASLTAWMQENVS